MSERRRHPRVESINLVSVGKFKEAMVEVARTLVVSEGGALLELSEPYPVHTLFKLDLAIEDDLLSVDAEVRDVAAGDDGTYRVGVRFVNLDPEAQERLERYVEDRRRDEEARDS